MAQANITQTCPQDWGYLSEGGSTIVFSYAGPFHPCFTGKVLRLRKILISSLLDDAEAPLQNNMAEKEADAVTAFHNTVIAPLVSSEFLPELETVLLDTKWLAALETLCDSDRPVRRRVKDRIDKTRQKGLLATDLIGGEDILAVEIKPKWGFMPNPAHLSPDTAEVKTSTCRFCMHARLNAEDEDVPTYCPLDLYSRDEIRMKKAIHDLWNGWVQSNGTLNNMKVFVSGKMIMPSEQSYLSLTDFLSAGTKADEALATALLPLLQTSALETISDLQRSLDALDIEGITKLCAMASQNLKSLGLGSLKQDPSLEEWRDFVASYRSVYCTLDHSKLRPENLDIYLTAYLLSATFKDCSVICRLRRSGISGRPVVPDGIYIIDLDLKGVNRFERWLLLDRKIAEHYRDAARHKLCVEQCT